MGDTRQDPNSSSYRKTVPSQYAVGDLGQGGTTVHDLAQAHLRGAVYRVLAPVDRELSEKDIPRGRWTARSQGQVGAALFGSGERPYQTVFSSTLFAGNQSRRVGLE